MARPPCIRYLRDYVAIPSVNPMGRNDMPEEIVGERRPAVRLAEPPFDPAGARLRG